MTEQDILKRIYPSVVTFVGNWQKQTAEVKNLKLKEISLFLTCAGFLERREIYQALEKIKIKKIPHIHARHDMRESEFDYLVKNYKTKVFTVHYQYYLKYFCRSKYRKMMYIENNGYGADIKKLSTLKEVGGICIDLAHMEHHRHYSQEKYQIVVKAVKNYKIGCNHLSAVKHDGKSKHYVDKISDLDYVKNIPKKYFSQYINLELGNSIKDQLRFKKYVAKLLARAWR